MWRDTGWTSAMATLAPHNLTLEFLQKLLAETEPDVVISSFEVRFALAAGETERQALTVLWISARAASPSDCSLHGQAIT
jgi:hypothetical protein